MMSAALAASLAISLHGQVIDEATRQPVKDAIILLPELPNKDDLIAVSDASGRFVIEGPRGTYLVEVQREGYATLRHTLEFESEDCVLAIRACPRGLPPFDRLEPGRPGFLDRDQRSLPSTPAGSLDSAPALGVLVVARGQAGRSDVPRHEELLSGDCGGTEDRACLGAHGCADQIALENGLSSLQE